MTLATLKVGPTRRTCKQSNSLPHSERAASIVSPFCPMENSRRKRKQCPRPISCPQAVHCRLDPVAVRHRHLGRGTRRVIVSELSPRKLVYFPDLPALRSPYRPIGAAAEGA